MKKCTHCTAENRDEAIFCTQCRRPLPATPGLPPMIFTGMLAASILIALTLYLFSSRSFLRDSPVPTSGVPLTSRPAPTRTKEPATLRACVRENTHIRRGPGTTYETIGGLVPGTCLTILGRNDDATWVSMVSDDHQTGWVAASLVEDAGDITKISVRNDSALAHSSRPTLTSAEVAHGAEDYLTKVAATNVVDAPNTRYVVPCFETANRIGDQVSCRMEKAYCDFLPQVDGTPTICNDRPYPDHSFTLVVFGEDWSEYEGQCIIVSGHLQITRGVLQIEALERSQVAYCD